MRQKVELKNYTRAELAGLLASIGEKESAAARVFQNLYRDDNENVKEWAELSRPAIELLQTGYKLSKPKIVNKQVSKIDGTVKFLFDLTDGEKIESVLLHNKGRASACLSSQAGCACGCVFCATGALGFKRDLEPSEIVNQFAACREAAAGTLKSVIFMGMGEPFLNWENVKKSILILSDNKGYNFPQSKITISTVGIVPGIRQLADSGLKANLAISVITADEAMRASLAPIDGAYPLCEVLESARYYCSITQRPVFLEYILFAGVNDTADSAAILLSLIKDLNCKINLIPYNKTDKSDFTASDREKSLAFQKILTDAGIQTYLRREKGADIAAACGQLAKKQA